MPKKVAIGVVTRDKCSKTRRVEIPRLVKHPKYGKFLRSKTVCYVHDEKEESGEGDTVEIVESIRRSKTKRWELVRVIEKSKIVDVAALRAAAKAEKAAADELAMAGQADKKEKAKAAKAKAKAEPPKAKAEEEPKAEAKPEAPAADSDAGEASEGKAEE